MTIKEIFKAFEAHKQTAETLGLENNLNIEVVFEHFMLDKKYSNYKDFLKAFKKEYIKEYVEKVLSIEFIKNDYGFENKELKIDINLYHN